MNEPLRIAMWSGPRNISTAMMRSWGSRGDTAVCDEPLYAHYLKVTGHRHPAADEIVARCETDWRTVVAALCGPVPGGRAIYFQKHMAHHVLPGIDLGWLDGLASVFLIRSPREMITSLAKVIPEPAVDETGLPQQVRLFEHLSARGGGIPPVIDSRDVLVDPEGLLRTLCDRLGVAFDAAMLTWRPGRRDTDGLWAPHWYAAVEQSTGFASYRPKDDPVPDHLRGVLAECETLYETLATHRLSAR